jgi:hypothetical protein
MSNIKCLIGTECKANCKPKTDTYVYNPRTDTGLLSMFSLSPKKALIAHWVDSSQTAHKIEHV